MPKPHAAAAAPASGDMAAIMHSIQRLVLAEGLKNFTALTLVLGSTYQYTYALACMHQLWLSSTSMQRLVKQWQCLRRRAPFIEPYLGRYIFIIVRISKETQVVSFSHAWRFRKVYPGNAKKEDIMNYRTYDAVGPRFNLHTGEIERKRKREIVKKKFQIKGEKLTIWETTSTYQHRRDVGSNISYIC